MTELDGRTIAVTGASRGIGRAVVQALTDRGAQVLAGARRIDGISVPGAQYVALDVTDEDSVRSFAAQARDLGVNALVNNAGVGTFEPFEDITVDSYRQVMDTNVLGTILVTRELLAHFKAHGGGQVVTITSDVSDRTFATGALYCASKHAQRALTRALAHEGWPYGLRVTEIRPGTVDSDFFGGPQGAEHKRGQLRVDDVAAAVVYALAAPPHARIDEIVLHPVEQEIAF